MDSLSRSELVKWFTIRPPEFPTVWLAIAFLLVASGLVCGGMGLMSGGGVAANDPNGAAAGAAVGGTALMFALAPLLFGLAIGGLAWSGYSGGRAAYLARITDDHVDALIEQDLEELSGHALLKTGIDAGDPDALVGRSVVITGPRFWNVSARPLWRKGKDNVIRYSPMQVTVINFTPEQVVAYTCALDLRTGKPLNETTDEYFYRDIVSVSTRTKSESWQIPGRGTVQLNAAETFTLTTSGGTSIEVFLRDPALVKKMGGGGEIPTTRAEAAVQTIRKMLREKKSSNA